MNFRTVITAAFIAAANGSVMCSLCGDGKVVTAPDAKVSVELFGFTLTCSELQENGINGMYELYKCAGLAAKMGPFKCAPGTLPSPKPAPPQPPTAPSTPSPLLPISKGAQFVGRVW